MKPVNFWHTALQVFQGTLRHWRAVLSVIIAVMTISPTIAAPSGAFPPLFGSREIRSSKMALFPKWQGALERYFNERSLENTPCTATQFNRCQLREWTGFVEGLRGSDPTVQVDEINRYLNRKRYIIDPRNYGVPDYWATPRQFLYRDGDCEDYAITKYLSLRILGFPASQMRIVVLRDLNLRAAHAVLVVYMDNVAWILDNQIASVVNAETIRHYQPIYSINEENWWLHRL
jgi:predicted transglutaminase-like cysteine proteinase